MNNRCRRASRFFRARDCVSRGLYKTPRAPRNRRSRGTTGVDRRRSPFSPTFFRVDQLPAPPQGALYHFPVFLCAFQNFFYLLASVLFSLYFLPVSPPD